MENFKLSEKKNLKIGYWDWLSGWATKALHHQLIVAIDNCTKIETAS